MDGRFSALLGFSGTVESEPIEGLRTPLPVAIDPHARLHVDASTEQCLELSAGIRARGLEHLTAAPDHDPLLRVRARRESSPRGGAGHHGTSGSGSSSSSSTVTAIECGSSSRADLEQLLPHELGGEEGLGLVGDHLRREVLRPLRQSGLELLRPARRRRRRSGPRAARRHRTRRGSASAVARWSNTASDPAASVLFTTRIAGVETSCASDDTNRSPGPNRPFASTTTHTTSTSPRVARARSLVRSPSRVRGRCSPGVSMKTIWLAVAWCARRGSRPASSAGGPRRSRPSGRRAGSRGSTSRRWAAHQRHEAGLHGVTESRR